MADGYNYIFKQLVSNDDDFVGMVAYTLYKRQKIEWIARFVGEQQRPPNDLEIEAGFISFSTMPSQLQSYREQAVQLLDCFLDNALSDKLEEATEQIRDAAIVQAVKKTFGQSVWENIVAGLAASLITLGAGLLAWFSLQGPESLLRQALEKYITK